MDYDAYRRAYFVKPAPTPRYRFAGNFAVTLYYADYAAAVDYYTAVLGPPAYVEGSATHGWPIGNGWLTLLQGKDGNPRNVEVGVWLENAAEAARLQRACIDAGGRGAAPAEALMYVPVYLYPVTDPFGVDLLLITRA